jgi:hypothetical protein
VRAAAGNHRCLHDGHLHHHNGGKVEEHALGVNTTNPAACTPGHDCGGHPKAHKHGPGCGHPAVPHGDHTDYLMEGPLHHPHGDHCDDHGGVQNACLSVPTAAPPTGWEIRPD